MFFVVDFYDGVILKKFYRENVKFILSRQEYRKLLDFKNLCRDSFVKSIILVF